MKGIILAGGGGSKLYPLTSAVNKHLLPVHNKPMIYYPLSTLMAAGIREILIVTVESDIPQYERLLGDGSQLGIHVSYKAQLTAGGTAHAFLEAGEFIGGENCALIFGDNIFYGRDMPRMLCEACENTGRATVFGYYVEHPEHYGVVEFNSNGSVLSLEEKPLNPRSHYAVTGLYFYNGDAIEYARTLEPDRRGLLEVTDLNLIYLQKDLLDVKIMENGFAWIDAGTLQTLHMATNLVRTIESCVSIPVGSPETVAYRQGWITRGQLLDIIARYEQSPYKKVLRAVADGRLNI
ncbi:MAG: glucose-1-phosphate thymidylyltransferase RfbA [Christensenellales bacterium]|jgi:glucose-1-phosphate thymidylyltransferase